MGLELSVICRLARNTVGSSKVVLGWGGGCCAGLVWFDKVRWELLRCFSSFVQLSIQGDGQVVGGGGVV